MSKLLNNITDERTGISYTLVGDHYLPDLIAPEISHNTIGRFGRERLSYLKNHGRVTYTNLLTSGRLNEHLHETDEAANDRIDLVSRQIAEREGITEKLKADDAMLWVQKMNNIRSRVTEIIRDELIYA